MKIEVSQEELELIKEALITTSVKYSSNATDEENIKLMSKKWSENQLEKSDKMITLINKL